MQPTLDKVEEKLGPINILVNNAGIAVLGGVLDLAPEDWDRALETKINACFLLSKFAPDRWFNNAKEKSVDFAKIVISADGIVLSRIFPEPRELVSYGKQDTCKGHKSWFGEEK